METIDLRDFLKKFGMTEAEIRVFKELSQYGQSTIGHLIKNTSLHRGTVYNTLQRLMGRGYIGMVKEENKYVYTISESAFISDLIREETELEERKKNIKEVMEQIKKNRQLVAQKKDDEMVMICQGNPAYKNFFINAVSVSGKQERRYMHIARGGLMVEHFGKDFYQKTQEMKKLMSAESDAILSKKSIQQKDFAERIKNSKIKWLPEQYPIPASLTLWNNQLIITEWERRPIRTIFIKSKDIAKTHRSMFKAIWNEERGEEELFS